MRNPSPIELLIFLPGGLQGMWAAHRVHPILTTKAELAHKYLYIDGISDMNEFVRNICEDMELRILSICYSGFANSIPVVMTIRMAPNPNGVGYIPFTHEWVVQSTPWMPIAVQENYTTLLPLESPIPS
jgi:hypothetical protein